MTCVVELPVDQQRLSNLSRIGRLLDEAVDLADACGESLLGAQIAQAIHILDTGVAQLQPGPPVKSRDLSDPGGGTVDS